MNDEAEFFSFHLQLVADAAAVMESCLARVKAKGAPDHVRTAQLHHALVWRKTARRNLHLASAYVARKDA